MIINVYNGSTCEQWLVVRDGRIFLHTENDGPRFLRRGPEAMDEEIDLMAVEQLDRENPGKNLVAQVKEALAEVSR